MERLMSGPDVNDTERGVAGAGCHVGRAGTRGCMSVARSSWQVGSDRRNDFRFLYFLFYKHINKFLTGKIARDFRKNWSKFLEVD
jgi:hypothetical protein